MEKKVISVCLMILVVCMLLAGCKKDVGTPEDNAIQETEEEKGADKTSGYTFGYSGIDLTNSYFDTIKVSLETLLFEQGSKLIAQDPKGDVNIQIEQIQSMIDQGIEGIFLSPVDRKKIAPALEALKKANIPVINVDTQVKDTNMITAYIGTDNKKAGFLCGEDLVKQRPQGGKIVILEAPSMNSFNERITGFEEAISKGGFEVLSRADVEGNQEKAYTEMKRILEENSHIDTVMCGNDQAALGALKAVQEAGRKDILIYGVDGSPDIKSELIKEDTQIAGTSVQSPINIGKKAVETGIAILEKKDYEKEIYEDTLLINKDNIQMYGTDGWQ